MRTDFRCVYCGREYHLAYEEDESQLDEVDREACPFCSQLYWDGYLARALRHYPMDSLVDAHWGETQARELRAEISTLVERANEQYLEQADEIAALRDELDRTLREADTYLEERAEQAAEIAALREAVRCAYGNTYDASRFREMSTSEAVQKALEEEQR